MELKKLCLASVLVFWVALGAMAADVAMENQSAKIAIRTDSVPVSTSGGTSGMESVADIFGLLEAGDVPDISATYLPLAGGTMTGSTLIDDGSGSSPTYTWIDESDETGSFQKQDSDNFHLTLNPATRYFEITGRLMVTGISEVQDEFLLDENGLEFQETDTLTDCSTFSATGGGIFFDDSEGVFKKCQDNVLTVLDASGGGDITDVLDCATGDCDDLVDAPTAFSSTDATPDVSAGAVFITANASSTTITDFDTELTNGKIIFVIVNDANTTFDFTSSGLEGLGNDYLAATGDLLIFVYTTVDDQWHGAFVPKTLEGVAFGGFPNGDRALHTDSGGDIEESAVTAAELAKLDGITSLAVGISDSQTLTNKGIDADDNTLTDMPFAFCVAASDETTDLTTGTAKVTFRMPYGCTLTAVRASVNTAPVGSTIEVDVNDDGTTVFSTVLTIDASEKTSESAAAGEVINAASLADDSEMTIDIDQIGSSTAGKGLKVCLIGKRNF